MMLGRLIRVLFGFALASLAAGVTMVAFVLTPSDLIGMPPDVAGDRLTKGVELAGYVAAQVGLFSAPFALVAAAIGEALHSRRWPFYAVCGLLIAALGFFAQHSTEQVGQPTIVNSYALLAFLSAGVVGGTAYWLLSGRWAGGRRADPPRPAVAKAPAPKASPANENPPSKAATPAPAATKAETATAAAKPEAPAAAPPKKN